MFYVVVLMLTIYQFFLVFSYYVLKKLLCGSGALSFTVFWVTRGRHKKFFLIILSIFSTLKLVCLICSVILCANLNILILYYHKRVFFINLVI